MAELKYITKDDVKSYFETNYTSYATRVKLRMFDCKDSSEFLGTYDEAYMTIWDYLMGKLDLGVTEEYRTEPDVVTGLHEFALFLTTPDVFRTYISILEKEKDSYLSKLKNPYESFQYWLVNYEKFGKDDIKKSMKMIDRELRKVLKGTDNTENMRKILRD